MQFAWRRVGFSRSAVVLFACLTICDVGLGDVITTNEAQMDAIFSQASFGNNPIDIRFGNVITLVDPDAASIDSSQDFSRLVTLAPSNPFQIVNLFFVNEINWCGGVFPNAVGCAFKGLGIAAVESSVAAGAFGGELNAHEVGHTLGLDHTAGEGLMGPFLNGDLSLTPTEVSTIFSSGLVQTDASGLYIQITPILIRASAVPEPTSLALACLAVFFFAGSRNRRHASV